MWPTDPNAWILHEERDGTHTYVVEEGKLLLRYRIHGEMPAPAPAVPEEVPVDSALPEEVPVGSGVPVSSPQPDEPAISEAEIVETLASGDETEEAPVAPAAPSASWSDSWAVGPARKR